MRKTSLKNEVIYNDLLNDICEGKLVPNDKLPSEKELAEMYNVSRVTVRNALEKLEKLDYIIRNKGKGTFVRTKVMEKKMNKVISFTESNLMIGNIPSSKVVEIQLMKAPLFAINHLKITSNDDVWCIKRVRYSNGLTVLYEESYWMAELCGEMTPQIAENSILSHLEAKGIRPYYGKQEFVAISASGINAKYLEVPEKFPILRSTMSFFNRDDSPLFTSINYYRTDRITVSSVRYLDD